MIADALRSTGWALALAAALSLAACDSAKRELRQVPVPDTSTFEPGVRARLANARAEFEKELAGSNGDEQRGAAYGKLAMAYHAQSLNEPPAAAYVNAHALAPKDKRWPSLLGQLYADSSRMDEAIAAFEAALAIDPSDVAAQVFAGRAYLKQGMPDKARPHFERAKENPGARAAALAGLGKVALAQQRY